MASTFTFRGIFASIFRSRLPNSRRRNAVDMGRFRRVWNCEVRSSKEDNASDKKSERYKSRKTDTHRFKSNLCNTGTYLLIVFGHFVLLAYLEKFVTF